MDPLATNTGTSQQATEIPPWLDRSLHKRPTETRPWTSGAVTAYISLFLWLVYFDQFPRLILARTTLGTSLVGIGIGACLSYLFLYLAPAHLGLVMRRPLPVVFARTFGTGGADFLPFAAFGLVQVLLMAVSIGYGTECCLRGLRLLGFLSSMDWPARVPDIQPWRSAVFMATAFTWCLATSLTGRYLVRIIIALMMIYPVLQAAILAAGALFAFPGLPSAEAARFAFVEAHPVRESVGPIPGASLAIELVFAFFAPSALIGVYWGGTLSSSSEVRRVGILGVLTSSWVIAALASLCVIGTAGLNVGRVGELRNEFEASWRFFDALPVLWGGLAAGVILQPMALMALAPACYAGFLVSHVLHERWAVVSRTVWASLAAISATLLIGTGWVFRLEDVFSLAGVLTAPIVGAMTVEWVRSGTSKDEPVARLGHHLPGLLGFLTGCGTGLLLLGARWVGMHPALDWLPVSVLAYVVSVSVAFSLSMSGVNAKAFPAPAMAAEKAEDVTP